MKKKIIKLTESQVHSILQEMDYNQNNDYTSGYGDGDINSNSTVTTQPQFIDIDITSNPTSDDFAGTTYCTRWGVYGFPGRYSGHLPIEYDFEKDFTK